MKTKTYTIGELRTRFSDFSAVKMLLFYEKWHNIFYKNNEQIKTDAMLYRIYLDKLDFMDISESEKEFDAKLHASDNYNDEKYLNN